jgi:Ca2+-binding RTX toxin-like protein
MVNDINRGKSFFTIGGDALALVGDALIMAGAFAELYPTSRMKLIGRVSLVGGDLATILGSALEVEGSASEGSLNGELQNFLGQFQWMSSSISSELSNVGGSVESAWNSVASSITTALNAVTTMIGDEGGSSFASAANTAESDLAATQSPLFNLFNVDGIAPQSITETATGDVLSVVDTSNSSAPSASANVTVDANGNVNGLTTSSNGVTLGADTESMNSSTGAITNTDQVDNSNGTTEYTQTTTVNSNGNTTASISGNGNVVVLNNAVITLAASAQATTDGNDNVIKVNAGDTVSVNGTDTITLAGDANFAATLANDMVVVDSLGDVSFSALQTGNNAITLNFTNGNSITLDTGTYTGLSFNPTSNTLSATLMANGLAVGTLSLNASGGGSVTLDTGIIYSSPITESIAVPATGNMLLAAPVAGTSTLQILADYFTALGDPLTAAQLNQANENFLSPATPPTVVTQGTIGGTKNGSIETYTDTFIASANNETITGPTSAVVNGVTVPITTNILRAPTAVSITQDTLTNIEELDVSNSSLFTQGVVVSGDQFNSFQTITSAAGVGVLTIADSGSFSETGNFTPLGMAAILLTAGSWQGTTLTGWKLGASMYGNDTLIGTGPDALLDAGMGVDTLEGSSSGDTEFNARYGLAAGSVVAGSGSNNTLFASGDISGATITGVQTLYALAALTLNLAEFNSFNTIDGTLITVSDTAANVAANLAALEPLAVSGQLTSITLTDSATPTLALTAAQFSADSAALTKISSAYDLSISGVLAANASTVAGAAHVTSITVSDTAANVLANISALESLEASGKVSSITVTDTASNVLANMSSLRSLESSGKITAIIVADTAADVLANVSALTTDANNGSLTSITLTDSTTPTISLTPSQLSSDSAVLQEITSTYNLAVSGGFVVLGNNQHVDISGSNDTVIPGLNDNFGVAGTNTSIMVDSEDGIFLTSPNGIANPLAALGSNAVVGTGNETISGGSGITVMVGNGGNNTFVAPGAATGGTVTVWGGTTTAPSGSNTVDYSSYAGDLEIVLGQGEGPGGVTGWVANSHTYQFLASLNDIDNVIGGSGNNTITGNSDNDIINGGNGNDWLTGGSGNDTFIVGTGNNTIKGGGGYDTYQFGSSFGQDVIYNSAGALAKGGIDFFSGITDEKLWFQQRGSDLLVDLLGTNGQIDVSGWFNGIAGNQVQAFNAGGLTLDTEVAQLVGAMATYGAAHPGFNPATATAMPTDTTLQRAITADWHS